MAAPTLTAYTTDNPWVEVFLAGGSVAVGTTRIRYYRQSEGRTWLVRGGVDVAPGVAAQDFEAPFGVVSSYRAEQFDASGVSLGFTDTATITLNVTGTWVHNPLEPVTGLEVELDDVSATSIVRPTPGDFVYPDGATVGRRIGSRRRGVSGMQLSLSVFGTAAANTFQAMLGDYESDKLATLCLRTSETVRWPLTFFFSSDEFDEQDVDVRRGGDWLQFVAKVTEVAPPFPGLVKPLLTYDDLDAFYGTYSAQDAAYATTTARDRDYTLAGYADNI